MDIYKSLKPLYWAIGAGVATFFIAVSSSNVVTQNGIVTVCNYTDYFAMVVGAFLLFIGLRRVVNSFGRPLALTLSVVVMVLGAVHLARGFGFFMSPCEEIMANTSP